jgi:hypothetical protein
MAGDLCLRPGRFGGSYRQSGMQAPKAASNRGLPRLGRRENTASVRQRVGLLAGAEGGTRPWFSPVGQENDAAYQGSA